MTLRLVVDTRAWEDHVTRTAAATPGLVPVVKGNGYGFGRAELARRAASFADTLAVGTVHELDAELLDRAETTGIDVVVLTPTLSAPPTTRPILTVGAPEHVVALRGWAGRVLVKLESSMHRYGRGAELVESARSVGLRVEGVSIHPPLAGTGDDHRADVERWLPTVPGDVDVWISHVTPEQLESLPDSHHYRVRLGTSLWHGDKSALHLDAEVLDTRPVRAGTEIGYRAVRVPADATVVMVSAGTAHGVHPLADGRSPFHHARRRLPLVEPPHMHTSMVLVSDGGSMPRTGDRVDVQQPLSTVQVDVVDWR